MLEGPGKREPERTELFTEAREKKVSVAMAIKERKRDSIARGRRPRENGCLASVGWGHGKKTQEGRGQRSRKGPGQVQFDSVMCGVICKEPAGVRTGLGTQNKCSARQASLQSWRNSRTGS